MRQTGIFEWRLMGKKRLPAGPPGIEEAVILALREGHREFLRFLSRRTRSIEEAEDILQDFYLKAIRSARTVKEPGALKGWLAQVLRRTLTDYYRRVSVRKAALQRLEASESSVLVIDDDADRAVCSCLYRILPTMPAEYSQLIWQIDLLGQPRSKVARRLGISPNNLGVRLHRARAALRKALMRFCTTCPTHGFLSCACELRPEGREEQLTLVGRSSSAKRLRGRNPKKTQTQLFKRAAAAN
jgi:RNA polymerase sigma-70 factor (ECF subfamily)